MKTDYFIDKTSGTSADTSLAIGFASFLGDLHLAQYQTKEGIFIRDDGVCYVVSQSQPLRIEDILDEKLVSLQIVQPLDSSRQREKLVKKGNLEQKLDGFPYDEQLAISRIYREQIKKLGPGL